MKVALLGASGTMGSCLIEELLSRQHIVTGICRQPEQVVPPENPATPRNNLTLIAGDATDPEAIAPKLAGHDAIIIAIRYLGLDTESLLEGIRRSGVARVIMVGHAGTLLVAADTQHVETEAVTSFFKPEALDAREAFKLLRAADDLAWTYAAPAALLTPGKKTGEFRMGTDHLIRDRLGESRISAEDFAIAIVDELEMPNHIRKRFTVAY